MEKCRREASCTLWPRLPQSPSLWPHGALPGLLAPFLLEPRHPGSHLCLRDIIASMLLPWPSFLSLGPVFHCHSIWKGFPRQPWYSRHSLPTLLARVWEVGWGSGLVGLAGLFREPLALSTAVGPGALIQWAGCFPTVAEEEYLGFGLTGLSSVAEVTLEGNPSRCCFVFHFKSQLGSSQRGPSQRKGVRKEVL